MVVTAEDPSVRLCYSRFCRDERRHPRKTFEIWLHGPHALGSGAAAKGAATGGRSFVGPEVSSGTEKSIARPEPRASFQPDVGRGGLVTRLWSRVRRVHHSGRSRKLSRKRQNRPCHERSLRDRCSGHSDRGSSKQFRSDSRVVIENSQIDAAAGRYAACSPPAGNEQMSHRDELPERPVDDAAGRDVFDWAVLVVTFALGCTLGWIFFLLWVAVRALRVVLS
jgi:hypothetical protein